ncbi:MAG: VOC family protein [Planctomycetia bacterium]|nr:VOC family protein [Planctomycetia bacterium]
MPNVTGILETALYVNDPERSARFYQTVFGFEIIVKSERLIALAVREGQVLLLFKKGASANLPQSPHDGDGQLHLAFAISRGELEHWLTWLPEHGIAIEEDRTWDRGGRSLYFRDPDQHLLEVATPGVWANY